MMRMEMGTRDGDVLNGDDGGVSDSHFGKIALSLSLSLSGS
jgi:hypothetical protein